MVQILGGKRTDKTSKHTRERDTVTVPWAPLQNTYISFAYSILLRTES